MTDDELIAEYERVIMAEAGLDSARLTQWLRRPGRGRLEIKRATRILSLRDELRSRLAVARKAGAESTDAMAVTTERDRARGLVVSFHEAVTIAIRERSFDRLRQILKLSTAWMEAYAYAASMPGSSAAACDIDPTYEATSISEAGGDDAPKVCPK